jgi:hypothetical protein
MGRVPGAGCCLRMAGLGAAQLAAISSSAGRRQVIVQVAIGHAALGSSSVCKGVLPVVGSVGKWCGGCAACLAYTWPPALVQLPGWASAHGRWSAGLQSTYSASCQWWGVQLRGLTGFRGLVVDQPGAGAVVS